MFRFGLHLFPQLKLGCSLFAHDECILGNLSRTSPILSVLTTNVVNIPFTFFIFLSQCQEKKISLTLATFFLTEEQDY